MKDFIYEGVVPVIYGAGQAETVTRRVLELGKRVLLVPDASFVSGGNLDALKSRLENAGAQVLCLDHITGPQLSKVKEGIALCVENQVEAVVGIGGGVCMDIAKSVAFGAANRENPLEKYLTYELSSEGLPHLPVVTIPTNPMSGSETNADVQITLDESGLQVGCPLAAAEFTWLNPEYVMSLPARVLAYGQMTAFVQLSCNYLNVTRSMLAERFAEASMKTIITSLRKSIADPNDRDARGTLMISSALSLSGINDLGREFEFVPYPLQSFAQRYLGLKYPQAMTGIFPYWMKAIYRAGADKEIFHQYFEEILQVSTAGKNEETILGEALGALKKLYQEFGIAFSYGELAQDPKNREKLVEIIASFGPMECRIMPVNPECLADIIEDAIHGKLD